MNKPEFHTVCLVDDIPCGQSRRYCVKDVQVAVFNLSGEFFALHDACPHAGASLARGTIEDSVVRCRIHHWGFCIRSGRYVDQELPQYDAKSVPLRIVGREIQLAIET